MDVVEWSPVAMTARPRTAAVKAGVQVQKGGISKSSSRAANYCCQVGATHGLQAGACCVLRHAAWLGCWVLNARLRLSGPFLTAG